jgi:hypothetical protein
MEATVITAIIGAIATILAAIITARTKDKVNDQLKKEWANYKNAVSSQESYLTVDYGVKIIYPKNEAVSGNRIEVKGTYTIMPPPDTLRLYTVHSERTSYGERFWAQEIVKEFFPDTKTWRARVEISGLPQNGGSIVVAIVSQPAIVLWDYYYKVGPHIGWWDIEGWANNSVVCDRVPLIKA